MIQGRNTLRIDSTMIEEIASNARRIRTVGKTSRITESRRSKCQLPPPDPEWNLTFYCDDISSCARMLSQNQYNELAGLQARFTRF